MQRSGSLISLLAIALVLFSSSLPVRSESAGQGKGGEIITKPTPTPSPKTAPRTKPPGEKTKSLPAKFTNQYRIEFVLIPPGKFTMGSIEGEDNEKPAHSVSISQPFYLARYEVAQGQWRAIMTTNVDQQRRRLQINARDFPARRLAGEGDDRPIYYVTWQEAHAFLKRLNTLNDGYLYRLPSEAEWEYACRAGSPDDRPNELGANVWYKTNSNDSTQPVGMRRANAFGLYDMLGNVWEWCEDSYHSSYQGAPLDGSAWLNANDELHQKVTRGGSFFTQNLKFLRCSARGSGSEDYGDFETGFRIVAVPKS